MRNRGNPAFANFEDKFVFKLGGAFRESVNIDYYDVSHDAWIEGPEMNGKSTPRYDFSCCILNGILYVFGGPGGSSLIDSLDVRSLVNGESVEFKAIVLPPDSTNFYPGPHPYMSPISPTEFIVFNSLLRDATIYNVEMV